ncbi:unnamed protein product [Rotaria sp. Silwood2]|nr:unnamed protein product [Rotaria sp. Silwood2]CAF3329617.1 unnamed protein product [Rotaria sp. Silwood2]
MATATVHTSAKYKKKILWFWQSNSTNIHDEKEKQQQWKRYSDFENDHIEEAYQRKEKKVPLNDYVINFEYRMQQHKNGNQMAIKREEIDFSQCVREERFLYPVRATSAKSFEKEYDKSDFISQWRRKEHKKTEFDNEHGPNNENRATAELAAQEEGRLINKEFDAQRMAEQLRSCKHDKEIGQCVARLYSASSFLSELVNSTLRNDDMSKLDTLGPFCWLLDHRLGWNEGGWDCHVYRGMTLTDEMIEEYKQAIGQNIIWPAFTSTTLNRQVAEFYCANTLFIIDIQAGQFWRRK